MAPAISAPAVPLALLRDEKRCPGAMDRVFPAVDQLEESIELAERIGWHKPSANPLFAWFARGDSEAWTAQQCDDLHAATAAIAPVAPGLGSCGLEMRPVAAAGMVGRVDDSIRKANARWWHLDVTHCTALRLTYSAGLGYDEHAHLAPGVQTHKLTAVVQLSAPDDYTGGDLYFPLDGPQRVNACRARGSVTVFPSWVRHGVSPLRRGIRDSLVVTAWGPPIR